MRFLHLAFSALLITVSPARAEFSEIPKTGKFYVEIRGQIRELSYSELANAQSDFDGMPSPYVIGEEDGKVVKGEFAEIENMKSGGDGMPDPSILRKADGQLHYVVPSPGRGTRSTDVIIDPLLQAKLDENTLYSRPRPNGKRCYYSPGMRFQELAPSM